MTKVSDRTELGLRLEEGLKEALAWKRGEIALPVQIVNAMSADRVKAIRKAVAKSPKEFEAKFGVPARTMEGWEQGRRQPDPTARAFLKVIEANPKAVEEALSAV